MRNSAAAAAAAAAALLFGAASAHPFAEPPAYQFPRFLIAKNDSIPKPGSGDAYDGCDPSQHICDMKELCALPFNSDSVEAAADTWTRSGAGTYMQNFLTDSGTDNWVDRMFQATIGGGRQGGSTYQCSSFPSPGLCTTPGHNLCEDYKPPPMFYVHIAIANFYNAFYRIHEALQDDMLSRLTSGVKGVVATFGPPASDVNALGILSGSLVFASAFAGPFGAPFSFFIGMIGVTSNAMPQPKTPMDFEHNLEKSLGHFYEAFQGSLEDTVKNFFSGSGSPVNYVTEKFDDGVLLDNKVLTKAVDIWINGVQVALNQGLAFQTLKGQNYFIWKDPSVPQERCIHAQQVWTYDSCVSLAKPANSKYESPKWIEDEKFNALINDYGVDLKAAIDNGIECDNNGGGEPDMSMPSIGSATMPACFVNLSVQEDEFVTPCKNPWIC